ncbi:metallophosphoesterase [Gemella cuniculi]|uniref:metallophosphoesterase n=1 Tax=Gemella cuniculi TaxID=150240 RepID=UPI00042765C6|nr:metallophosphoesterase [Gemella cuniculi]
MKYKLLTLAPIIAAGTLIKQNKKLKTTHLDLTFNNLPKNFKNFRIAHVSDIHCAKIGISDLFFLEKLRKFSPDIIVITGDILDNYNNDMDIVYNILSQLSSITPCYFVSGNHELRLLKEYDELKKILKRLNITNLNNTKTYLTKGDEKICLVGIEDYNFFKEDELNHRENFKNMLSSLYSKNEFNILLSHRPEKIDLYAKTNYNLVFSGHAHGGQWQLPFIGGIFSPSQGFFPKYIKGTYIQNKTTLVVSQGLGNSSFPIRFNNQIELVLVTLNKK